MTTTLQNLVRDTNNRLQGPLNKEAPQQGSEQRTSLLPSAIPNDLGFFGSPYNPADAMKTPPQLGIRVGNSISDVAQAVKGVGFYTDQIGFGAPSTGLTNGMPLQPLGVNYFLNTGTICSNGAQMWEYIQGIPEGDALGEGVKRTMAEMGLPPLKGLAPGMLEDVKRALDPSPLLHSVFGSGYPQCRLVSLPVGDAYGRKQDPATGESWISDPDTATFQNGKWFQKKWVQDKNQNGEPIQLTRDQWVSTPKTHHPNGQPKQQEGFETLLTSPGVVIVLGLVAIATFSMVKRGTIRIGR
jgi:hypothetical protein